MESKHKSASFCLSKEIYTALHLSCSFYQPNSSIPALLFLPSLHFFFPVSCTFSVASTHFICFLPFAVFPSLPPFHLSPRSTELSVTLHIPLFYHPFNSLSPFIFPVSPPGLWWCLIYQKLQTPVYSLQAAIRDTDHMGGIVIALLWSLFVLYPLFQGSLFFPKCFSYCHFTLVPFRFFSH